jgi:hypothetical protein
MYVLVVSSSLKDVCNMWTLNIWKDKSAHAPNLAADIEEAATSFPTGTILTCYALDPVSPQPAQAADEDMEVDGMRRLTFFALPYFFNS